MPGRIEFEFTTRNKGVGRIHTESSPMRMLVMGDFSGDGQDGSARDKPDISKRKLHTVDLDNLDKVVGRIAPRLTLAAGTDQITEISFPGIDDFHPDSLIRSVHQLDELEDLRKRLHNRESYPDAAVQLRKMLSLQESTTEAMGGYDTTDAVTETAENDDTTLERLLGRPAGATSQAVKKARSSVTSLINEAVRGHIIPEADAGQQVYYDAADQALADLLRQVLHHPDFQALEACWRSIEFMISRLELNEEFQLVLLDVTKDELRKDATQAGTDLEQTELYQLLIEQGVRIPGTDPWSLIVGQYRFDESADDTRLLAMLGNIAAHAGGPFIAEASPALIGCESMAEHPDPRDWAVEDNDARQHWEALRASPVAQWIGLALPRMLLRLPYGPETDEIDSFVFEEITDTSEREQFLWGNPAIACAALIGQAFTEHGWELTPGDVVDIGDLPAYSYTVGGEQQLLPCAEAYLTETAAEKILEQGLMPIVSLRNANTIRLLRFQSIASPAGVLAGAWA